MTPSEHQHLQVTISLKNSCLKGDINLWQKTCLSKASSTTQEPVPNTGLGR